MQTSRSEAGAGLDKKNKFTIRMQRKLVVLFCLVLLAFADFVSEAFVSEVFALEAFVSFSASVASVPFIPFFPSVGNLLFRSDVLIPDWLIEKAAWFGFPAISST